MLFITTFIAVQKREFQFTYRAMYKALCIIKPMFFRKYISSSSKKRYKSSAFCIARVNPYYIEPRNKWVSRMEICILHIHLGYMGKILV